MENDDAETPLYKAFQAGHAEVVDILVDRGANACTKTRQNLTPLDWLLMIPESSIDRIAKLVVEGGADTNAVIAPEENRIKTWKTCARSNKRQLQVIIANGGHTENRTYLVEAIRIEAE